MKKSGIEMAARPVAPVNHASELSAATVWSKDGECHFKTAKMEYMFTLEIAAG